MDIRLETPNFSPSENLQAFVNEKVGKLFEKTNDITHAEVYLTKEGNGSNELKICEIRLSVPGNDLFVKKESLAFEQSILEAVDTMQITMNRQKTKEVNQRNDASVQP